MKDTTAQVKVGSVGEVHQNKGYGFITADGGRLRVFFHRTERRIPKKSGEDIQFSQTYERDLLTLPLPAAGTEVVFTFRESEHGHRTVCWSPRTEWTQASVDLSDYIERVQKHTLPPLVGRVSTYNKERGFGHVEILTEGPLFTKRVFVHISAWKPVLPRRPRVTFFQKSGETLDYDYPRPGDILILIPARSRKGIQATVWTRLEDWRCAEEHAAIPQEERLQVPT